VLCNAAQEFHAFLVLWRSGELRVGVHNEFIEARDLIVKFGSELSATSSFAFGVVLAWL